MDSGVTTRPAGLSAGLKKIHALVLLAPIGILSIIIVGLTGATFESLFNSVLVTNDASPMLMSYAGPAATLAIAAVISGALYALGSTESWIKGASALSTALITWAFGLVAFGFACKQANIGNKSMFDSSSADYGIRLPSDLKALSGLTIILVLLETAYVLLLHLLLAASN
ncbi:hypothetical protein R1flu_005082 [Riccia fluitans]|uniref:Uncharacterized protein n=1 Tax=Riccia fluitans TaxID=41844 RepID=A0ABD1YS52_9MARC